MSRLLGIDFGTTNIKAVVFAEDGTVVSSATQRTPTHVEGHLRAVYEPEEIWQATATTIRGALDELGPSPEVDGLAISSMAESVVPVDAAGRELYSIIAWFDDRTIPQRDWWREHLGAVRIFNICGVHLDYIFSINKILWMREHEPDVFRRAVRWLGVNDYLNYRLTGEQMTSPSIASRTMAFDVGRRDWSETMLNLAELPLALFPPVQESGTLVGTVTAQAAAETGLPVGTPVLLGGHDHLCGALASQVVGPGPVLNSVGTSEVLLVSMDHFSPQGEDPEKQGFSHGCHVVAEKYYAFGGIRGAGHLIEWLRRLFEKELEAGAPRHSDAYQAMVEIGQRSPPGSKGLFVLPFVAGGRPHRDAEASGVFFGLRMSHTMSDVIRAAFEGLSYELRRAVGALETFSGQPIERLTGIGGGTKNELWLRVKADITGKPIDLLGLTESAALGAALLAGLGTGVYAGVDDATRQVYRLERMVEPNPFAHEMYNEWYEQVYSRLYPSLRESFLTTARLFPEA